MLYFSTRVMHVHDEPYQRCLVAMRKGEAFVHMFAYPSIARFKDTLCGRAVTPHGYVDMTPLDHDGIGDWNRFLVQECRACGVLMREKEEAVRRARPPRPPLAAVQPR